jgi:hypothetical protein
LAKSGPGPATPGLEVAVGALTVGVVVSLVSVVAVEVEVVEVVALVVLVVPAVVVSVACVLVTDVLEPDVLVDVEPPVVVEALTTAVRAGAATTPNANRTALTVPAATLRTSIQPEVSPT